MLFEYHLIVSFLNLYYYYTCCSSLQKKYNASRAVFEWILMQDP